MIPVNLKPGVWPGLGEAIQAAGLRLECDSGNWLGSEPAVQDIIDAFTEDMALAAAVAQVTDALVAHANRLRAAATVGHSEDEKASWSIKRAEALAYAGDPAACPNLALEAARGGITVDALVASVKANALELITLESIISGVTRFHRNAIAALPVADVLAYDWSAGWPS